MRDDRRRLEHVLEAISQIERYAVRGEKAFRGDELIQSWMVRHIQIIGEAARGLSPELRNRYPEVPWLDIMDMRNVLVHEYFGIDPDIVWRVIDQELPDLKRKVVAILEELGRAGEMCQGQT